MLLIWLDLPFRQRLVTTLLGCEIDCTTSRKNGNNFSLNSEQNFDFLKEPGIAVRNLIKHVEMI